MIEQIFKYSQSNETKIERVILDENLHFIHMVFERDQGLPIHFANSNVYMTVVRGTLSIGLDDQEVHEYGAATVLVIPVKTKMNVRNLHDDTLELIIVKAPAPVA